MRRVGKLLIVVALAFPFSGCPGGANIALGVWLFTTQETSSPPLEGTGLVLLQDGYTVGAPGGFPGVTNLFTGTLTWEITGNTFTLTQDLTSSVNVYTGTIDSPTSMSGTYTKDGDQSPSGTWSAEYGEGS